MESYKQLFSHDLNSDLDRVKRLTVTARQSDGSRFLHIRVFEEKDGKFRPTYEGVSYNQQQAVFVLQTLNAHIVETILHGSIQQEMWIARQDGDLLLMKKKKDAINGIRLSSGEAYILKQTVPALEYLMFPPKDLTDSDLLFAVLISEARQQLRLLNNDNCEGCRENYPSQFDHACLTATDSDRMQYFDKVKLDMTKVGDKFHHLAKAFKEDACYSDKLVKEIRERDDFYEALCGPSENLLERVLDFA